MSAILAENFKNLLIRNFPNNAIAFTALREVYKRTTLTPIEHLRGQSLIKRTGIVDTFKVFSQTLLPEMERSVEQNLLQNLFEQVKDERAKDSILQAYHKRRLARLAYSKLQTDYQYYPPDVVAADIVDPPSVFIDVDVREHDAEDIANYMRFTPEEMEKYFPKDCFGSYKTFEYAHSKNFGVMCTEEGLQVVNCLRGIMLDPKNYDYSRILKADEAEMLEILKDEEIYPRLYHLLSKSFIDALKPYRRLSLFQKLFHTSPIFDALVNVMVQEMKHSGIRTALLDDKLRDDLFRQLAAFIEQNADHSNPNPLEIPYFMQVLGKIDFQMPEGKVHPVNFANYKKLYKKLPANISRFGFPGFHGINSGVFMHGDKGTGKSGVLLYAAMWAHKMGWIVVSVPNVEKWTLSGEFEVRRHYASGLYLQQEYAVEFLEQFKSANLEIIRQIPVNMAVYGKYNGAGVHQNDPEPNPNLWDPDRKIFIRDEQEKHETAEEKNVREKLDRDFEPPMSSHLPMPKSLLQIVNFGIDNPIYSTNAIYELLEQLYEIESHHVLICVDQYNLLFRPSTYPSYRYENDRDLKGRIPPYHMALCRAFLNFDGHKIKNGFKLVASGIPTMLYRHEFTPEHIFFPKGYQCEMKGLLLDDYRKMLTYYHHVKIWRPSDVEDHFSHEWLWTQTQGNWLQTLNILLKCSDQSGLDLE